MAEMNIKQIIDRLNAEFTGDTRKLVFWYDDNGEFVEDMQNVELENAKVYFLQADNQFATKLPKVVAKRGTAPSFRSKWIAQSQQHKPPSLKREAAYVRLVVALFPVSLAQAGTYPHGWYSLFKLQGERFFFPVRPIAHEKVPRASCFKKFF